MERLGLPVMRHLAPGATQGRIEEVLGADVPEAVADWYRWHDGLITFPGQLQDDVNIIPGYGPISLGEAAHMKPAYEGDQLLSPYWIPILANAGSDIYAAVWGSSNRERVARVAVVEDTFYEFSGIEEMLSVVNRCYELGIYRLDEDGFLDLDDDGYDRVVAEMVRLSD
jgi:hypothetical protein